MGAQALAVREAMPADAQGIARVQVDTWRATYRGVVPAAYLDALSYERRARVWAGAIRQDPARDFGVFVAEHPVAGVVGFASCGPERAGDPAFSGELYAVYVLPAYQRTGLGRRLVVSVATRLAAAGLGAMLAWVLAGNHPARAFYEALGGHPLRGREVEIGGVRLPEVGYGWTDVRRVLADRRQP
jgi:ribosomal protein S18 acetylase RimI-like enzyme